MKKHFVMASFLSLCSAAFGQTRATELGLSFLSSLIVIVMFIIVLSIYVGLYVLVALMAKRRNRSAALWVIVSLLATPLLAIIILLCIGKSNDYNNRNEWS